MKLKLKGKYVFHKRLINWSYLSLGKDVLTHINRKTIKVPFIKKIKSKDIIKDHPPKNIKANKKLINMIWAYSAKKNKAKDIDEYSTL